jgi:hypothetical protein
MILLIHVSGSCSDIGIISQDLYGGGAIRVSFSHGGRVARLSPHHDDSPQCYCLQISSVAVRRAEREVAAVGTCLVDGSRDGRSLQQPGAIGAQRAVERRDRMRPIRVEQ